MGNSVNLVPKDGGAAIEVPIEQAADLLSQGSYRVETGADVAQRAAANAQADVYGGPAGTVVAGLAGVARGATFGLSDAGLAAAGASEQLAKLKQENPYTSLGGEIVGSLATEHLPGMNIVGKLAAGAGRVAEDAGVVAKLAGSGAKGAIEGAAMGAGQGVSELALSDDPLTLEHAASVIGSNALFGGATGGAVGVAGKGMELGLSKARSALDKYAVDGVSTAADVGDDLANLDRRGLRAAEKTELDAIETARVPQRAQVADEIQQFRKDLKENKLWLATKGAEEPEIRAIGKRTLKADRTLDSLLDDPKALAENPKAALSAMRKQEAALDELVNKRAPALREKFAADTSGDRVKALDYASNALERNRALQEKITALSGKPVSDRLEQIQSAVDRLNAPKVAEAAPSMSGMLGDVALGHAVGALTGIPYVGPAIMAGKAVAGVMKKLGANTAEAAARGSKAIGTFLDVSRAATSKVSAPVLASKVLSNVSFGEQPKPRRGAKVEKAQPDLAQTFLARSNEIRQLTAPGPDGSPQMRTDARAQLSSRLAGVRAASPVLADRIETNKARAVEFLASKLPRRPDLPGQIAMGKDTWQPPDMEMRAWARSVAAVEDPHGVIERLADGTITPEDAEAMRTVYPEMYADVQRQIMMQLGELQAKLPYQRRLALSIFSGVPVDPAMDPRILGMLQGQFETEEGTEGGAQAPRAQPQFGPAGSIKSADKPTPAQAREST